MKPTKDPFIAFITSDNIDEAPIAKSNTGPLRNIDPSLERFEYISHVVLATNFLTLEPKGLPYITDVWIDAQNKRLSANHSKEGRKVDECCGRLFLYLGYKALDEVYASETKLTYDQINEKTMRALKMFNRASDVRDIRETGPLVIMACNRAGNFKPADRDAAPPLSSNAASQEDRAMWAVRGEMTQSPRDQSPEGHLRETLGSKAIATFKDMRLTGWHTIN